MPTKQPNQSQREDRHYRTKVRNHLYELLAQDKKIAAVEVEYDGYGDSGQIESITYLDTKRQPLTIQNPALFEAVDAYVFSLVPWGWENGTGAFGTVRIDVRRCRTSIAHNTRFEDYETETIED